MKMPKELDVEHSLIEMKLARKMTLDEGHRVLAVARTSVPGEVRAKYYRDKDVSAVEADVIVDGATLKKGMAVHAVVHVKLTYRGDMVRSSDKLRQKIGLRLQEVAQEYCAREVMNEIAKGS